MPVDHFRPKGRVAECEDHEGYWWLALNPSNFRLCCTFCNSRRIDHENGTDGGKQDHFPLCKGSQWAKGPTDSTDEEDFALLDPTLASNPRLLWFRDDGHAVPRYVEPSKWKERAEISVQLYHLNHAKIVSRRTTLHWKIHRLVRRGNRFLAGLEQDQGDKAAEEGFEAVMEDILELLSPRAEFSASARACIQGLVDANSEWLQDVLRTH